MKEDSAPQVKPRPKRAEPLQPDRPGRGNKRVETDANNSSADATAAAKSQREQSEDALSNVRDGYGGDGGREA